MNPSLPVVSGSEVIDALTAMDLIRVSQRGSHAKLRNGVRTAIVPLHKELAPGTLRSIIRQADISVEEFLGRL